MALGRSEHAQILGKSDLEPMTPSYHHACRQGGPALLPITWDRIAGGGRVACPMCGVSKLTASIHGHTV